MYSLLRLRLQTAACACAGRLLMGYIPEQHLHARGTPRTLFLALTAAVTAAAALAVAYADLGHLYVLSVLLGVAFGAHWSLLPAITRWGDAILSRAVAIVLPFVCHVCETAATPQHGIACATANCSRALAYSSPGAVFCCQVVSHAV